MESTSWFSLAALVDDCTLPPLPKPWDEYRSTQEYVAQLQRGVKTADRIPLVVKAVKQFDDRLGGGRVNAEFAASVLLLLYEMRSDTPWVSLKGFSEYSAAIRKVFRDSFGLDLFKKLPNNQTFKTLAKDIFISCMEKLHRKLTKDAWKRHPVALYCYRTILYTWTKTYKIKCPLPLIFPGIFIQIDDYEDNNKVEGMRCCQAVLRNVENNDCDATGYAVVIYESLFKYIVYNEIPILCEAMECLMLLLPVLVTRKALTQWSKIDDVVEAVLNNLYFTDNDRKKIYWKYMMEIMELDGNVAIRWKKKILKLITESLEFCISNSLEDKNRPLYLNCLECWLKNGWCVWKYSTDKHLILLLFKILYISKGVSLNLETYCLLIMLKLCSRDQRKELLTEENVQISHFGKEFKHAWIHLKKNFKY
ncbi:TELO2-interacting protein 2-like [Arctopsyche grandis]|uniref:TELO2-interacting protein 2-like n=1 Tax=Arctopsyche grandis TaxID=121162 RepID=UPI00406D70E6